jgi:hypothetical protein
LNPDFIIAKKVREQLRVYKLDEEIFGSTSTKEDKNNTSPREWWDFYRAKAPKLQCLQFMF